MLRDRIFLIALGLELFAASAAVAQISIANEALHESSAAVLGVHAGHIRIRNDSPAPHEVRLYTTGYVHTAAAGTGYVRPDSQRYSNASWLRISEHVTVPAGSELAVPYEVTVPEDAVPGATYWTVVMVEPNVPAQAGDPSKITIRTVTRYAVQIATHVRGDSEPKPRLGRPRVEAREEGEDRLELVFEVANDGVAAWRPRVSVELFDTNGSRVATRSARRGLLYSGMSVLQRFDLDGVAPGDYEALVTVDVGRADLFGAQLRITVPR